MTRGEGEGGEGRGEGGGAPWKSTVLGGAGGGPDSQYWALYKKNKKMPTTGITIIIIAPRLLPFSGLPVGGSGPKSQEINLTPSRTFLHCSGTLFQGINLEKTKFKICSSTPGGGGTPYYYFIIK